jgi:hypothetical protein
MSEPYNLRPTTPVSIIVPPTPPPTPVPTPPATPPPSVRLPVLELPHDD